MKYFLAFLLSFSAAAANYAPAPVVPDIASLTNRGGSLINPAVVVLGATNAFDGRGGIFLYSVTATNAIDNIVYFPSTAATGKWVRTSYILSTTPAASPLSLANGTLSLANITNWFTFSAGSNMSVTVTGTNVTYAMTNTVGTGGGTTFVNGTAVTNLNLVNGVNSTFVLSGTNASVTVTNGTWIEDTFVPGANFEDSAEVSVVATGTNVTFGIIPYSVGFGKLALINPESLMGYGTGASASDVRRVTLGANLYWSGDTINATTSSSTNSWQIGVDGSLVIEPNLADAARIAVAVSGTNVTFDLVAGSITAGYLATNGVTAGTYTNATVTVDAQGLVTSIASGTSGGGGLGTNLFVNGVLIQPAYLTNSAEVFISTNGNGHIVFDVNDWDGFWTDLTNSLVAGSNISFSYGTNNQLTISASTGVTNSGTSVSVNGAAALSAANFTNSTGIAFNASGSNVTAALVDRDFGDITTSSSGTVMTIDNNAVTSNKVAAANITQDKLGTSGTGNSTNFLAGDYTYKQVTTNMIPGLVADIAALQRSLTFTNGVTNVNNVVSANLAAGSNITFTTNNSRITIASTASGGGSVLVNGSTITNPNFTNSSTVLFSVANGTNVTATVTNVAGSTTDNVVQRIGSALFYLSGDPAVMTNVTYSGAITNVILAAGGSGVPLKVSLSLSGVSSTNYVVFGESYETADPVTSVFAWSVGDKTTTGVTVYSGDVASAQSGSWVRIWILDTVSVGGQGGGSSDPWGDFDGWIDTSWRFFGNSGTLTLEPNLVFSAISSGLNSAPARPTGGSGIRTAASATVTTGGVIHSGASQYMLDNNTPWQFGVTFVLNRTNGVIAKLGFLDSTTTTDATDACLLVITNSVATMLARSNNIQESAGAGFVLQQNVSYTARIFATNNFAWFGLYSNVAGASPILIDSAEITNCLPIGASRSMGMGFAAWNTITANTNAVDLLILEHARLRQKK